MDMLKNPDMVTFLDDLINTIEDVFGKYYEAANVKFVASALIKDKHKGISVSSVTDVEDNKIKIIFTNSKETITYLHKKDK